MSSTRNMTDLFLVGGGVIGCEYSKILSSLGVFHNFYVRNKQPPVSITNSKYCNLITGGFSQATDIKTADASIIIATDILSLFKTTRIAIAMNFKNILVEKPGCLVLKDLETLREICLDKSASVKIAYNRRFYANVRRLKALISSDAPIVSGHFRFTERERDFNNPDRPVAVKANWLAANSSHVIDLFKMFCGNIDFENLDFRSILTRQGSNFPVFVGSGVSSTSIPYSFHADWGSVGGWELELFTSKVAYKFSPLERLLHRPAGHTDYTECDFMNDGGESFKCGYESMIMAFLKGCDSEFPNLDTQLNTLEFCQLIGMTDG